MARIARIVLPNHPHHVQQDSLEDRTIFHSKDDYNLYLDKLEESAEENEVQVIAWCLLPKRIHLVLQPKQELGLAKLVRQVHSFYGRAYNQDKGESGSLWGERFASCAFEPTLLDSVVRYVERASLGEKSRRKVENYEWSSAAPHCSGKPESLLGDKWPFTIAQSKWSEFINQPCSPEEIEAIDYHTRRGYLYGGAAFQKKFEKKLGRQVVPARSKAEK